MTSAPIGKDNPRLVQYVMQLASYARPDVFAVRNENGQYRPKRRAMTRGDVVAHLKGQAPSGVYLVNGDKTQFGALDLDDHDKAMVWPTMQVAGLRLTAELVRRGLKLVAFRSGGGAGVHIWVLFSEPQSAASVIALLKDVVQSAGFRVGADGGISAGTVEVFPKQSHVEPDKLGNLLALPLARASVPLNPTTLDDRNLEELLDEPIEDFLNDSIPAPATSDPPSAPAATDQQIEAASVAAPRLAPLPGDLDVAADALRRVSSADYDIWIRIGLALKHAFGDDGFRVWRDWSATSAEKFPGEAACRAKWEGFRPSGAVGLGTIFHLAREGGWNGGDQDNWVREMNADYGILTHNTDTLIILKQHDNAHEVFGKLGRAQLYDRLAAEKVQIPTATGAANVSKAKLWFEHPRASRFEQLEFDPSKPPGANGKTWNMWTGFAFEPAPGDWSLLQEHVRANIAAGDETLAEWLLNWMALAVQERGHVIGTVPAFIGVPGSGKSFLANAFGALWGRHFVAITNHEHVQGRFTGHLLGRRFIFVDEGIFGGNRKEAGVIKTRVTEKTIMHELKGVDPMFMPNRTVWMIASNEKSVVPADKGDRRWQMFDVCDARARDRKFFEAVRKQLEAGGYAAMLHDLLARDLDCGPDPAVTIKNTALFDQMLRAQGPEERYLVKIFDEGRLPQNYVVAANATTIRALHEDLQRSEVDGARITANAFGRMLQKVIPGIRTRQHGRFHVKERQFADSTEYTFPPLSDCRRALQVLLGCDVAWSNDRVDWAQDPLPTESYTGDI
ncbi:MAG: PriCT-2 domain-containing protein [Hyphomonadaceae bacterium]|nr:PriCT-2 domain-containing protein [Hyphomonadaceae bacterium]